MQDYVKPFLKSQIFDHRDNTFSYETNMNTAEVREDALRKGREEGRSEGENRKLISLVCRKLIKHRSAEQIAEALEEDPVLIAKIVAAAQQCAPDYDEDKVYEVLMKE